MVVLTIFELFISRIDRFRFSLISQFPKNERLMFSFQDSLSQEDDRNNDKIYGKLEKRYSQRRRCTANLYAFMRNLKAKNCRKCAQYGKLCKISKMYVALFSQCLFVIRDLLCANSRNARENPPSSRRFSLLFDLSGRRMWLAKFLFIDDVIGSRLHTTKDGTFSIANSIHEFDSQNCHGLASFLILKASQFGVTSRQLYIRAHSAPCELHCPKAPAIPPISYFILRANTRCSGRYLAGTWSLATPYRDRDTALNHRLAVVTIPGG